MKTWVGTALDLLAKSLAPPCIEQNEIDWKLTLSPNSKRMAEHLCAFSNYPGGGFLVFGVGDDGNHNSIEQSASRQIVSTLSNIGRESIQPPICLDHAIETYQGSQLLFVNIIESLNKPVHLRNHLEQTYVRSGATSRLASREELVGLMQHSKVPRWEELRASPLLSDEELILKLNYADIFRLLGTEEFTNQDELLAWLQNEKFIAREPAGGGYLTNLGLISAAWHLGNYPEPGEKGVRLIVYRGVSKTSAVEDVIGKKGYAVGFQGLIRHLMRFLPTKEDIDNSIRRKLSVYPENALREIIANALIHQDFSIPGMSPLIEVYDDRVEVSNPGRLLPSKKADRLIGTQPESRNPTLANAFMRYRICEQRGSGVANTIAKIEEFGLPPVEFENGSNFFKVTIHAPRTFLQMTADERLAACFQHACLKRVSKDVMTNKSLRERLRMRENQRSQVSVLIAEALAKGLIKQADPSNKSKKHTEYVPYYA